MRRILGDPHAESRSLIRPTNLFQVLSLLGIALCLGCSDRLTAPEAVRLVDALESSHRVDAVPGWWDFLFGSDWLSIVSRARELSTVQVLLNGQPRTYHALVFERVLAPVAEVPCAGTRRWLFLWREGDKPDGIGLAGGRFDERFGIPMKWCTDQHGWYMDGPEPTLWRVRPPDDPHGNGWRASDGEGEIKPGVVAGGCVFLTPEAERVLRDQRRMSCEVTRHQVWFRGELRRWAPAPPGKPLTTSEPDPLLRVELSSTEIMGVRYTVHCDVDSMFPPRCPRK